jgi:hypothetical protein
MYMTRSITRTEALAPGFSTWRPGDAFWRKTFGLSSGGLRTPDLPQGTLGLRCTTRSMSRGTKAQVLTEGIPSGQTEDDLAPLSYRVIVPHKAFIWHSVQARRRSATLLRSPSGINPEVPWPDFYGSRRDHA